MAAIEETPEPHCQYCRANGRLFTISSPGGYASYVCAACFRRMAVAGRRGRNAAPAIPGPSPNLNLIPVNVDRPEPAVLASV